MGGSRKQVDRPHESRYTSKASRQVHRTSFAEKGRMPKPDHHPIVVKGPRSARIHRSKRIRGQKWSALLKEKKDKSGPSSPQNVIVSALLLLSQQEEMHLLEREVNVLLQKKLKERHRELSQIRSQKRAALLKEKRDTSGPTSPPRGIETGERNKTNRVKHTLGHTSGTNFIARTLHEMAVANDRIQTDKADMLCETHIHGVTRPLKPMTPLIENIETNQTESSSSSSSTQIAARNDTLTQVLGKDQHGRLQGTGSGATATNTWGPSRSNEASKKQLRTLEPDLQRNRTDLRALRVEMNAMKDSIAMVVSRFGIKVPWSNSNSQDSGADGSGEVSHSGDARG